MPEEGSELVLSEPDASSPRRARRWAASWAGRAGLGAPSDDLLVVLSELVTNAVVHGRGPVRVRLSGTGEAVRMEVEDGSPAVPTLRPRGQEAPGGRGLVLVAALSRRWGVEPAGRGKAVWAEVPVARPTAVRTGS